MTPHQISTATASKKSVLDYLLAAYDVTEIQAVNAVSKHQVEVERGERLRSHVCYVADLIARAEGFVSNPEFDPDSGSDAE